MRSRQEYFLNLVECFKWHEQSDEINSPSLEIWIDSEKNKSEPATHRRWLELYHK